MATYLGKHSEKNHRKLRFITFLIEHSNFLEDTILTTSILHLYPEQFVTNLVDDSHGESPGLYPSQQAD